MHKNKKVILHIILLIILLICLIVFICLFINKTCYKQDLEYNINNIVGEMQITDFNIYGRTIMIKDNAIYVGNNIKELQNNFYDIKILNYKNRVEVFLNKLWYENYGTDYIQDEYLAEICRQLSSNLNIEIDKEQFSYSIYKYVKDNYIRVKQDEKVEEITVEKVKMQLELSESIVKLIIKRGD